MCCGDTKLVDRDECTACGACASICRRDAISIEATEEGFYYPVLNEELCVNCGACSRVCPIMNDHYRNYQKTNIAAYALRHYDKDVLMESTSGGAFTAIVESFIAGKDRYALYGAAEQPDLTVSQVRIDTLEELNSLRKSKYVESYSGKIYRCVKKDLDEGRYVCYSGTPCQIAGLISYLKKPYDNLLTVEIVCHGVPSTLLLKKYIAYRESKMHEKCEHIEYRSKKNSNWMNPKIRLEFTGQRIYEQKSYASDDEYMIGFCKFLCLRRNCGDCKFANPNRVADFTIADLWGIESSDLKMEYENGISLMLVNSDKARFLIPEIESRAEVHLVDYEFARSHNQQLVSPAEHDPRREEFLKDLVNIPFENLRSKYLMPRSKVVNWMSNTFSRETKAKIKKVLGMKATKY